MANPRTAGPNGMIRANNSEIDIDTLRERVRTVAARLRESGIIEERRRERAGESATSPRIALARYRAINALLDRAEDLNQPRTRLPRRVERLYAFGERPVRFAVKVYNFVFRLMRDSNQAQIQAVRELSEETLLARRRTAELEREVERLRKLLEERSAGG